MATLFSDKIRALREEKHLLQKHLADALGVTISFYSRIESGERPASKEQVNTIASALTADSDELLKLWLADKIGAAIGEEESAVAIEAIEVVKSIL